MKQILPQEDDKNCQSTKYYASMCTDKKCQTTKCYKKVDKNCQTSDIQLVEPKIDVQSMPRLAKIQSSYKKYQDGFKSQFSICSDKNYQENINMWSVMPEMDMQLPKPAIRRLCNDKNCQSTRCYN